MKCFLISILSFVCFSLNAQVEIYRNDGDTAAQKEDPKDTIVIAPKFENGDADFYRYIETHMNMLNINSTLSYSGTNIKFAFTIDKDGEVGDFQIITFSDANIAHELERVINRMPNWTPGVYHGKKKKILMIYDLNIKRINDFSSVQVTPREASVQYTKTTNQLKWAMVVGSVLILLALLISRS